MTGWFIALLAAVFVSGVTWYFLANLKIKSGWQNGTSFLARYLDARRREKFNMQLPDALATMSNSLRAGFSIVQSFGTVVEMSDKPISEEFEILQRQLSIGMSFEDALDSMSQRVGSDDLTLVTTAILISRKTGGNVTEIFDKISETIRGRMQIERKVKALTAQGRLQGIIVSLMPILLGAGMTVLKPKLMIPFFCSFQGVLSCTIMFALIIIGWLMIRKIIKIDV
jgi:tight adherence protein B